MCTQREIDAYRSRFRRSEVELHDFVGCACALVANVDGDIETAVGSASHGEIRVRKRGVGQPESEREQGLNALPVEPAVADEDAFGIAGQTADAGRGAFRMRRIVGEAVLESTRPGERQPPGGA